MRERPSFTLGIEEEYLLADSTTRDLISDATGDLLSDCEAEIAQGGGQVCPEFMRSQVEVGTKVCRTVADARDELLRMRKIVARCAARHGCAPIAASTHPFAAWENQLHTDKDRYHAIAADLRILARRLLISGMHVHVGIEDDDLRVKIMNRAAPYLPHLLALSASSPFWRGIPTGLKSYRTSVFSSLPRTGLPVFFASYAGYECAVAKLVKAGAIEDATKIWWDLRLSARYPTLEMRITDLCPLAEDGIAIAALFLCICRMVWRRGGDQARQPGAAQLVMIENRWRAQRDGVAAEFVDCERGKAVPFRAVLDELLLSIREDAEALDCVAEVERTRTIAAEGTSARRQLAKYHDALDKGASERKAMEAVVDLLIEETTRGIAADVECHRPAACGARR